MLRISDLLIFFSITSFTYAERDYWTVNYGTTQNRNWDWNSHQVTFNTVFSSPPVVLVTHFECSWFDNLWKNSISFLWTSRVTTTSFYIDFYDTASTSDICFDWLAFDSFDDLQSSFSDWLGWISASYSWATDTRDFLQLFVYTDWETLINQDTFSYLLVIVIVWILLIKTLIKIFSFFFIFGFTFTSWEKRAWKR